jgi:hypothetical protein
VTTAEGFIVVVVQEMEGAVRRLVDVVVAPTAVIPVRVEEGIVDRQKTNRFMYVEVAGEGGLEFIVRRFAKHLAEFH